MSSTTERSSSRAHRSEHEDGQVLVLFAGSLVLILLVAALVFDIGQALVDRRTEQNAADSAALAGARYIPTSTGTYQGLCTARSAAVISDTAYAHVNAACDAATQYLAQDGLTATVTVKYPPGPESVFSGQPDNIEVEIDASRPSFFAGVIGIVTRHTGAMGVAENSSGYTLPYSMLALDPTSCGAISVTGGGTVSVAGTIHADSSCSGSAIKVSGRGAVAAPSCDAVGGIQVSGGATGCDIQKAGAQALGDPLRELPVPAVPAQTGYFEKLSGGAKALPGGCYGTQVTSSGITSPTTCSFNNSYSGYVYRMHPGYYPGGLQFNVGTFYMEPGIYVLGGGGLRNNGAALISVDSGTTTFGGGVLLVDGSFQVASFCAGATTTGCVGNIDMAASGSTAKLLPLPASFGTVYTNMLIFVDRQTSPRPAVTLNGDSTTTSLAGTIYAPTTVVTLNGNAASSIVTQIIAYDFTVNGNRATLDITYNSNQLFQLTGVGLVQ